MVFNLGEHVRMVRAVEAKIKQMEDEFDAKMKPLEDFAEQRRTEILQFLNKSRQKSANTEFGTAYWKPRITYRIEDKDAFRRHVIGAEAWELTTWASAPVACEAFTDENKQPPPGLVRNAENVLYITAPAKPRKRGEKGESAEATAEQEPKAAE